MMLELLLVLCRCDVGLEADVRGLASPGPMVGVVHAGGILNDAALPSQTAKNVRLVFGPKQGGLQALEAAWASHPLAHAVLFSSIAAVTGPAGSANYAAANALLDATSSRLSSQGMQSVSIQWGAWSGLGMVASSAAVQRAMQRTGVGMVAPGAGLGALHHAIAVNGTAKLVAIPFNWQQFMSHAKNAHEPVYQEFAELNKGASPMQHLSAEANVAERAPHSVPPAAATTPGTAIAMEDVASTVSAIVAAVHGESVLPGLPLVQAGLDSLSAVELRNKLQEAFSLQLPGTLVFDYPTVDALVAFIYPQLASERVAISLKPAVDIQDVLAAVVDVLKRAGGIEEVPPDAPLMALGLDSLSAVELRQELSRSFDIQLPSTLIFDHPTAIAVATHIQEQLNVAEGHSGPATRSAGLWLSPSVQLEMQGNAHSSRSRQLAAIDASVHRLSAPAPNATSTAAAVVDTTQVAPLTRWDVEGTVAGISHRPGSRFGRFLADVHLFDASSLGISPTEAALMDPQQRLMLEVSFWTPEFSIYHFCSFL